MKIRSVVLSLMIVSTMGLEKKWLKKKIQKERSPSTADMLADDIRMRAARRELIELSCTDICQQCIEIPVSFHVIGFEAISEATGNMEVVPPYPNEFVDLPDSELTAEIFASAQDIDNSLTRQMDIINTAFEMTPFKFCHANPGAPVIANRTWTFGGVDFYSKDMKEQLGSTDPKHLDVFIVAEVVEDEGDGQLVVGTASFPGWQNQGSTRDLIAILIETLPGLPEGGITGSDTGLTLAHEIGHWLGLYHVFQESDVVLLDLSPCDPRNPQDFVTDTAPVFGPFSDHPSDESIDGCHLIPQEVDSCPNLAGNDPIFNIMNYIENENCLFDPDTGDLTSGFTCGQNLRMYQQYKLYREHVTSCTDGEIELELFFQFGEDFFYDDRSGIFLNNTDTGEIFYNSTEDFCCLDTDQEVLTIDLCLREDVHYEVLLTDAVQDGLSSYSYFEVRVNGEILRRIEGDFGACTKTEIRPADANTSIPFSNDCPEGFSSASHEQLFHFSSPSWILVTVVFWLPLVHSTY